MNDAQGTRGKRRGAEDQLLQVFALQTARSSTVLATIALILVCPLMLLPAGAAVAVLPKIFNSWWAFIGEVILVALVYGLGRMVYRLFQEAFPGRCYLALTRDALVLRHPLLLRRPLKIPLTQIDRIAVSSPRSKGFWEPMAAFSLEKEDRGLTWIASEDETVAALDVTTRCFLPLASHVHTDEPNVAVVTREAIDLTRSRRKPISSGELVVRRLCDVDQTRGFLVRLEQPGAAERTFEARGLLRKFDGEQASLIDPTDQDVKRFRRWRRRTVIGYAVSVLLFAELVWAFVDNLIG